MGVSYFVNQTNLILQTVHITIVAVAIIILVSLIYEANSIDSPLRNTGSPSGEFVVFSIVNAIIILGIVVYECLPNLQGITTFPGLLLYTGLFASIIFFMKDSSTNKERILSIIFVFFIWTLVMFLVSFLSIYVFDKYNLSPDVWYWTTLSLLSLFFLFIGLMYGYIVGYALLTITNPNLVYLKYAAFLYGENKLVDITILRFIFYSAIFMALVFSPIIKFLAFSV